MQYTFSINLTVQIRSWIEECDLIVVIEKLKQAKRVLQHYVTGKKEKKKKYVSAHMCFSFGSKK